MRYRRFTVVIGGDCSVVLGCLLGARKTRRPVGLVYVDAHADFATALESKTGSVASMSLALATGRGDTPLARLAGHTSLVDSGHVALLGRRDRTNDGSGDAALAASSILDLPDSELLVRPTSELAAAVLARVAGADVRGFWIHLDVDVINPAVMSAVDSAGTRRLDARSARSVARPAGPSPTGAGAGRGDLRSGARS